MTSFPDTNNPDIQKAAGRLGYFIQKIICLEEINAYLYLLEHKNTGAKHAHISNNDKENTFGVAFKTVPSDSTGVAHILEHTALCGSRKFPVHDPFFFHAQKKPKYLYERFYRIGLDHVSVFNPEQKGFL